MAATAESPVCSFRAFSQSTQRKKRAHREARNPKAGNCSSLCALFAFLCVLCENALVSHPCELRVAAMGYRHGAIVATKQKRPLFRAAFSSLRNFSVASLARQIVRQLQGRVVARPRAF